MGQRTETPVQLGVLTRDKYLQRSQCSAQEGSTAALAESWFCSKNGPGIYLAKTTRITTKASDDHNNSPVEDSQDERAKEQQSSFLKVFVILNNRAQAEETNERGRKYKSIIH